MIANQLVHRFAVLTSFMTFLLLCAGALVTSTGSGLAVPDWPLSFGMYMPPMVGGVFFEHGHRMVAGTVGIMMAVLCVLLWVSEPRRWVKVLGTIALGAVVTQAVLGGMTVLYRLPTAVSVSHACLAQFFFSLTTVISLVTSRFWLRPMEPLANDNGKLVSLPALAAMTAVGFFLQLLMGAVMRHTGSGLAIPDFPLAFGRVVPEEFSFSIGIHYAHRVGAFVMVALTATLVIRIVKHHANHLALVTVAGLLSAALAFQFMLGASVIWLKRPIPLTTAHLAVGALCLASSVCLTVLACRLKGYFYWGTAWQSSLRDLSWQAKGV